MPPRTANSPTSRTVGDALEAGRLQPRDQRIHVDLIAGRGLKGLRRDHGSAGGTRCTSALTVVRTTARCGVLASADAARDIAASRLAAASAPGETRS